MSESWTPLAKVYHPVKCSNIDGIGTEVHDHGVVRAMNAVYKPNKSVAGNKDCTLFVGKLNHKTDEKTVKDFFTYYAPVKRIRLVRDLVTGYSKGYAFIEFEDEETAKQVYKKAHGLTLDGCTILVDFEHERSLPGWIPRRLGGGFGGRKESGQLRFGCRERPFKRPLIQSSSTSRKTLIGKDDARNTFHHKRSRKHDR